MNSNSLLIIAGELSGDVQGGKLVAAIKELSPDIKVTGIGGDNMEAAGMELLHHIREMSFLGFSEVLKHLPFIRKIMNELTDWIETNRPETILLIDYPGFNLKLAARAKKLGCRVVYYISPQIWAWGGGRIKKIARFVDHMIVVFPFEEELYKSAGVKVDFVGHPILEGLNSEFTKEKFFEKHALKLDNSVVGLLPGSRAQEVENLYLPMLEAVELMKREFPNLQFVTGVSPTLNEDLYKNIEAGLRVEHSKATYDLMKHADLLFVASGTATLESACFGTPMIIVYKVSAISWLLGKMLIKLKNIGLVNIVAGKQIVPELLQSEVTAARLAAEGVSLLGDKTLMEETIKKLLMVKDSLGKMGASKRAAEIIVNKD
ncbi:MAG: lipid-A-disaccharide synthase [Candidatus Marinimicrobia bacterium]|nr:lipid-A-disaccharide synthase [Candidatus Neomarinimicrobiota bacterium]